jgi:hypothetical protein
VGLFVGLVGALGVTRLYTARYANKTLARHPAAKVRITLGHPRFPLSYQLAGKIPELAPTREMFGTTPAEFTSLYTALLVERGGVEHLTQRFVSVAAQARTDELVLLCFEDLRTQGPVLPPPVFRRLVDGRDGTAGARATGALARRLG